MKGVDRDVRAKAGTPAHDPARLPDFSEALSPLIAQPAAAFAAATAIGFGIATQAAGVFFGMLQGAMEATNRLNRELGEGEGRQAAERPKAVAEADVAIPVKPKPAPRAKAGRKPLEKLVAAEAATKVAAPRRQPRRKAAPATASADDLKKISGIGPKLEKRLNDMGVMSFADIAGWSDADVGRFDRALGIEGRIGRDDWVGQARKLTQ